MSMELDDYLNLGKAFLQQYYQLFDQKATRPQVANLYHTRDSTLLFEGDRLNGAESIMKKYGDMNFGNISRDITTLDVQPLSGGAPGALIQILGQLRTDSENDKVMAFSQTFVLRHIDDNFYLCNDIFRLVLHNA